MPQEPFLEEDAIGDGAPADEAAKEEGTTYAPSLLIGLGGTGAEVLLRVKKQLQEQNFEEDAPLRFLFIDTDQDTFSPGKGLPDIEEKEKCFIGKDNVGKFLDATDDETLFPALKSRFPESHLKRSNIENLSQGIGASQIRSLGAFAVALEAGSVKSRLERAYNDLTKLKAFVKAHDGAEKIEIKDQVYIYVVGSLAGGTGSGGFLDVGMLSKHVCDQDDPKLIGMFALPDAFDDVVSAAEQKITIRANTYAALKELQFCLDTERQERKDIGTIPFEYDSKSIEQKLRLEPRDSLFDLCYLVDERNSKGRLSGVENLYSLMARSLLHDVGSPFGAHAESLEANNTVLNEVSKCPKTNLGRLFGTISTSALSYPASRVANYCTYRTAESVVQDHLIGTSPAEETLRTRLSDFLDRQDLEDRGEANQLLESLLRAESSRSLDPAPESGELVSPDRFALSFDYGEDLSVEKFARQIRRQWSDFSDETLSEIEDLVDQNRHHRIGEEDSPQQRPLREAVEKLALSTAAEHGARGAGEILEMLEEVASEMRTEFREESDEWEERKEWLAQEFTDSADELAQVGTIKALFTSEDEDLKKHLIELYGELVEGALWEVARPAARKVLDKLIAETRDVASRWGNLLTKLTRLRKTLRTEANERETHNDHRGFGFAVDQEITRPGHERRYFRENGLTSEAAFDVVLDAHDDASVSRADLFRDALQQETMEFANHALIAPLYDHIKGPIFATNVVEFAESNPGEVVEGGGKDALKKKLEIQSNLCQPFWPAETREADEFDEFKGISAPEDHFEDDGTPVYSPVIDEWMDTYGYEGIPSANDREIVLSRKTYGARAFYLDGILDWKSKYELRQKESERDYMIETHTKLRKVPDLLPSEDEEEPVRFFALGMALGFIIQRGDWYYFGLRRQKYEDEDIVEVIYEEQDWESIHRQKGNEIPKSRIGNVDFSNRRNNFKDEHLLKQGRKKSVEELKGDNHRIGLLREAVNEYHQSVGNRRFKEELEIYEDYLEDKSFSTGSDIYGQELDQIRKKISEIGE